MPHPTGCGRISLLASLMPSNILRTVDKPALAKSDSLRSNEEWRVYRELLSAADSLTAAATNGGLLYPASLLHFHLRTFFRPPHPFPPGGGETGATAAPTWLPTPDSVTARAVRHSLSRNGWRSSRADCGRKVKSTTAGRSSEFYFTQT